MSEDQALASAWRELASRFAATSCALERGLQERHGLGMSEFEVLDRLAEAPEHRLRMQELADVVHLSQSALSRAVARLERGGLACRVLCEQDRRGVFVTLTEAGRARHAEARPTQRALLAQSLRPAAPALVAVRSSPGDQARTRLQSERTQIGNHRPTD
ncbi:MarR family transcriptional regulator [Micromonospora sp. HM5-17]|uniref:MarR family transcriptional regulator n=1 Tax=Micromonospora sp. HM5-17 TaxID=2487710 RepID=UPI001F3921DA|nr:MarR family transcriptional regulator [Micromonospora sp. HM5-17]